MAEMAFGWEDLSSSVLHVGDLATGCVEDLIASN
jgi:hypothetical protein